MGVKRHQKPTVVHSDRTSAHGEKGKRGPKPKPIVDHPTPHYVDWVEPDTFGAALALHVRRHGETLAHLHKAIIRPDERFDRKILYSWADDRKVPGTTFALSVLHRIADRYRLPAGYFHDKLPETGKAPRGHGLVALAPARRRRVAWHLPDNFDVLPPRKRREIVDWVERVIVSGQTDYRQFLAEAMRSRYALRFPGSVLEGWKSPNGTAHAGVCDAPPRLVAEVTALIQFKTKALTRIGENRVGVWGDETASQKIEHMALMFGALCADPEGPLAGAGMPVEACAIAHIVHPAVWDWYLGWRERRRGFFTSWEVNMLALVMSLTRRETGWLWQNPPSPRDSRPSPGLSTTRGSLPSRATGGAHASGCTTMRRSVPERCAGCCACIATPSSPFSRCSTRRALWGPTAG